MNLGTIGDIEIVEDEHALASSILRYINNVITTSRHQDEPNPTISREEIERLEAIINDPDFDYRYLTMTTSHDIVYTKNMTTNAMTRLRTIINDINAEEIADSTWRRYRHSYPDRMVYLDHLLEYRPRELRRDMEVNLRPDVRRRVERNMDKQTLLRNLNRLVGTHINEHDTVSEDRGTWATSNTVYQDDMVRWLQSRNYEYINGMIQEVVYDLDWTSPLYEILRDSIAYIDMTASTLEEDPERPEIMVDNPHEIFGEIVKRTLIGNFNVPLYDEGVAAVYSVWLTYVNAIGQSKTIRVSQNLPLSIFEERLVQVVDSTVNARDAIRTHLLIPLSFYEYMGSMGSDIRDEDSFSDYHLDISKFKIQRLRLEAIGGNNLFLQSLSKDKTVHVMNWCKLYSYNVNSDACFWKVLSEGLKNLNMTPSGVKTYRSLRKYVLASMNVDIPMRVSFQHIVDVCNHLRLTVAIHNADDGTIYRTTSTDGMVMLRVAYSNSTSHYYHVIDYIGQGVIRSSKVVRRGNEYRKHVNVSVYYDIESVNIVSTDPFNNVRPYALSYKIVEESMYDKELDVYTWIEPTIVRENVIILDSPNICIFSELMVDLRKVGERYDDDVKMIYTCIAYNGSRFDHVMLYRYLMTTGFYCILPPMTGGMILNMMFVLFRSGRYILKVWDPYRFTMTSLKNVCKSYRIDNGKLDLDHNAAQRAYEQGRLKSWLNDNRRMVERYSKRDVDVLHEIVDRLRSNDIFGDTIMESPTIASFCYDMWLKDVSHDVWIPDVDCDIFFRKAMIGGRCESSRGRVRIDGQDMTQIDVVSLYPYVMKEREYPLGEPRHTKEYVEDALGIYRCRVEVKRHGYHTVIPHRLDGENLNWSPFEDTINLTNIDIERLKTVGDTVEVLEGWVWDRRGRIFEKYIDEVKEIKTSEDVYRDTGDSRYNPTRREIGKLMMNSLSGKVGQKMRGARTGVYQNQESWLALVSRLGDDITDADVEMMDDSHGIAGWVDETIEPRYPVHLLCFIYSYARDYMYESVLSKCEVLYMDTDSAVVCNDDYEMLIRDEHIVIGSEMGEWTVDMKADSLIVISPKCYMLWDSIESRLPYNARRSGWCKMRCKGVVRDAEWESEDGWRPVDDGYKMMLETYKRGNMRIRSTIIYRDVRGGAMWNREIYRRIGETSDE